MKKVLLSFLLFFTISATYAEESLNESPKANIKEKTFIENPKHSVDELFETIMINDFSFNGTICGQACGFTTDNLGDFLDIIIEFEDMFCPCGVSDIKAY